MKSNIFKSFIEHFSFNFEEYEIVPKFLKKMFEYFCDFYAFSMHSQKCLIQKSLKRTKYIYIYIYQLYSNSTIKIYHLSNTQQNVQNNYNLQRNVELYEKCILTHIEVRNKNSKSGTELVYKLIHATIKINSISHDYEVYLIAPGSYSLSQSETTVSLKFDVHQNL